MMKTLGGDEKIFFEQQLISSNQRQKKPSVSDGFFCQSTVAADVRSAKVHFLVIFCLICLPA